MENYYKVQGSDIYHLIVPQTYVQVRQFIVRTADLVRPVDNLVIFGGCFQSLAAGSVVIIITSFLIVRKRSFDAFPRVVER